MFPRGIFINILKGFGGKFGRNMGYKVIKEGGNLKGFRVRFIKRGSVLEQLGLKREILSRGINGETVSNYSHL